MPSRTLNRSRPTGRLSTTSTPTLTPEGNYNRSAVMVNHWYSTIATIYGGSPAIDANSATIITDLSAQASNFLLTMRSFAHPVYYANSGTATQSVYNAAGGFMPNTRMLNVPIPAGLTPDTGADGNVTIINTDSGCMYDFWKMNFTGARWEASMGISASWPSDAIYTNEGANASGIPLAFGCPTPQEILNGVIPHALYAALPNQGNKNVRPTYSPPGGAWFTAGSTSTIHAIHCGMRLRLKPAFDISGLSGMARIIGQALKDYGMIQADGSANPTILSAPGALATPGVNDWNRVSESVGNFFTLPSTFIPNMEVLDASSAQLDPAQVDESNACCAYSA